MDSDRHLLEYRLIHLLQEPAPVLRFVLDNL